MITSLLRKSLLATLVTGVGLVGMTAGLVGMTAAPAGAVGALAGAVTGSIHLTPGLPTANACATEVFTFAPITLGGGAIASSLGGPAADVAVGGITTDLITGGTTAYPLPLPQPVGCVGIRENELAAAGFVNPFGFRSSSPAILGNISNGNCAGGTYLRIGVVMLVDLTGCALAVNGARSAYGPPASSTDIRVAALFLPDVTRGSNGVTTPIADAFLAGVFGGATLT